jgi:hypothetical protein
MRRRIARWSVASLILAAACATNEPTSPTATSRFDKGGLPGSKPGVVALNGRMHGCTPTDPQYGVATIGPSGGELVVGSSRLIVPPGALTTTVTISGRSGTDSVPAIYFEPHGLQFKKSAGLILDASSCTDVPDVVYLNDVIDPSPLIRAVYSSLWHTVAAPIDHFSGYEVAFREEEF